MAKYTTLKDVAQKAGTTIKDVYDQDPEKVKAFLDRYPSARAASSDYEEFVYVLAGILVQQYFLRFVVDGVQIRSFQIHPRSIRWFVMEVAGAFRCKERESGKRCHRVRVNAMLP